MRTSRQTFFLILALGFLNALTPFSIDLYLPAFPEIARDLNTAVARMSLTVSIYFIGFAIGQILYGPLLDRFGRKRPLYFGLALYIVASVGCMTAKSVEALLAFRFLSAIGGCAASVGTMTMVRDFFPPASAARVFSTLMLVLSVSPLLAPSIGSFIVVYSGWRVLFGLLCAIAVVDIALVRFALPVQYQPDPSVSLRLWPILQNFREILRNPRFWVFAFAGALSFSGLFMFVAGAPGIFMQEFKVGPQVFGLIFACLAGGMIAGSQLNHVLVHRYGSFKILKTCQTLQTILSALFFLASFSGSLSMQAVMAFLFMILVCSGISNPNGASLALESVTKNIGSASALLGFIQLSMGSVLTAILGLLNWRGSLAMATVMCFSTLLAFLILRKAPMPISSSTQPVDIHLG